MKELAICFSGQPRCIDRAFLDFQKLFEGLDYDIFAHIWDSEELLSSWGHGMGWENKQQKVFRAKDFVDLFNPTEYIIDKYDATEFYKHNSPNLGYGNPVNKVWSSYSQFYTIKKSFEVKNNYETKNNLNYKYIVKYRMDFDVDFEYSNLTTKESILDNWKKTFERLDTDPNLFLTNPGWDWPNGNGVSNLLAVGKSKTMNEYSKLFDFFPKLYEECEFRNWDEAILKLHLEQNCNVNVGDCGIHVGVYR
jgi:hypothetical protein